MAFSCICFTAHLQTVFISSIFLVILFTSSPSFGRSNSCNEAVCASIVSKCMLTQSCKCDSKNITCSKDCFLCLDFLYSDCCSCVEMCPPTNETTDYLSMKSHVEDLAEPFPDLFGVLTEEKDELLRWTSYSFPVEIRFISQDKEVKIVTAGEVGSDKTVGQAEPIPINCTVAYMSQCMPWNKCKAACSSMGASSYRWFHDGCCECVGSTCINYGINESRCLDCPPDKEQMTIEELNVISQDSSKKEETSKESSKKDEDIGAKFDGNFKDLQDITT